MKTKEDQTQAEKFTTISVQKTPIEGGHFVRTDVLIDGELRGSYTERNMIFAVPKKGMVRMITSD